MKKYYIVLFIHYERIYVFDNLLKELTNKYNVIIFFDGNTKDLTSHLEEKINSYKIKSYFIDDLKYKKIIFYLFNKVNKYRNYSFAQILLKYIMILNHLFEYNFIKHILKNIDIQTSIFIIDRNINKNVGSFLYMVKNNIPIIIPHFMLQHIDKSSTHRFRYSSSYYTKSDNLSLYQKWKLKKYTSKEHDLQIYENHLFYPIHMIEAVSFFGIWTKSPWCNGGSQFSNTCLDNHYTQRRLHKYLKFSKSIHVTGDLAYDMLYENYVIRKNRRIEIEKKYKIRTNNIVLFSVPQIYEHGNGTKEYAKKEIKYIMDTITSMNRTFDLLLVLHPKMRYKNYKYLESEYNCKIIDEPTYVVLPVVDMYIPVMSTTVTWAILCGIKSCNIGYHNEYYHTYFMYDIYGSSKIVKRQDELSKILLEVFDKKNINFHNDWNILDRDTFFTGTVTSNYLKLIDTV